MGYLNIEKLKAGTVYKTDTPRCPLYFKMVDESFMIGVTVDGPFSTTTNLGHFTHNGWEEVSYKKVWALTETAKAILDNVTTTICLKCGDEEDYLLLLEALQTSTDFKWRSGNDLLDLATYYPSILLHTKEKYVTQDNYETHIKHFKDSVFIDFSASKAVLVDTVKIAEVIE